MSAPTFALLIGLCCLGAGTFGMLPSLLTPPPADAPAVSYTMLHGYLLGLFPTNALHSALNIVLGLWGLAAWTGAASAVAYARFIALFFAVLAVLGAIPVTSTLFGFMPIHGLDVVVHAVSAGLAAYFGFRSMARHEQRMERRQHLPPDRRQSLHLVAYERRRGSADRRFGGATTLPSGF